ncbi:MAG: ral secretion pathway protein [Verrucomicrobiaceae bacterium]|nr:ral secretion pathway protein [Verrucomicrobiaceae bacterium]
MKTTIPTTSRFRRAAAAQGFTLVEMVLVLGIIALLLGAGIYNLTGVLDSGKIKRAKADIATYGSALRTYELNGGFLPSTEQGLNALVERPSARPAPASWTQVMKKLTADPWGNPYNYRRPGTKDKGGYDVYSNGPDGLPDTGDDVGNWDQ